MSQVNLFFSRMPSCRYVFPDGSEAAFIAGRYATSEGDKIQHLDSEISKGHQYIFRDPLQLACDESDLDPMEAMKKKIISEYLEQQAAQALTSSTSEQAPLKPASSADLVDTKTPEEIMLAAGLKVVDKTPAADINVPEQADPVAVASLVAKLTK